MRKNGEIHYSRFPSGEPAVVRRHEKKKIIIKTPKNRWSRENKHNL